MSLIGKLLDKLLGGGEAVPPPRKNTSHDWYQLHTAKTQSLEQDVKNWLSYKLEESGEIPFTWTSGNGKAILRFQDTLRTEDSQYAELKMYLIHKLEIPEDGEFIMQGMGTIYLSRQQVKVRYSSTIRSLIDIDDDTAEEVYSDEAVDEGDLVLFAAEKAGISRVY